MPKFAMIVIVVIIFASLLILMVQVKAKSMDTCSGTIVSISKVGFEMECEVSVAEAKMYSFLLEFEYPSNDKQDRQNAREALGTPVFKGEPGQKKWTPQTHPITVEFVIAEKSSGRVHAKELIKPEASILGSHSILAEMIKGRLQPEVYTVHLKIIETNYSLDPIKTVLRFKKSYTGAH